MFEYKSNVGCFNYLNILALLLLYVQSPQKGQQNQKMYL